MNELFTGECSIHRIFILFSWFLHRLNFYNLFHEGKSFMKKNINAIRTFNRFELKYVLSLKQAEAFRQDLLLYMSPDLNGTASGNYRLGNLYYDIKIKTDTAKIFYAPGGVHDGGAL